MNHVATKNWAASNSEVFEKCFAYFPLLIFPLSNPLKMLGKISEAFRGPKEGAEEGVEREFLLRVPKSWETPKNPLPACRRRNRNFSLSNLLHRVSVRNLFEKDLAFLFEFDPRRNLGRNFRPFLRGRWFLHFWANPHDSS